MPVVPEGFEPIAGYHCWENYHAFLWNYAAACCPLHAERFSLTATGPVRWRSSHSQSFPSLLEERGDINPESPKRVGVEPVRLALGGAQKISDGRSTQSIEKSENAALLHD